MLFVEPSKFKLLLSGRTEGTRTEEKTEQGIKHHGVMATVSLLCVQSDLGQLEEGRLHQTDGLARLNGSRYVPGDRLNSRDYT